MRIRIAGTLNDSIVDGPGFRYTVFTQGCLLDCPGCHNPETHPIDAGKWIDTDLIIAQMDENHLLDGLTLSGGDPILQPEACTVLARAAKLIGLNVWIYTGWTFEELLALNDPRVYALLSASDVLVDGRFQLDNRTLGLRFRGSANQRLIDLPLSLKAKCAVEHIL